MENDKLRPIIRLYSCHFYKDVIKTSVYATLLMELLRIRIDQRIRITSSFPSQAKCSLTHEKERNYKCKRAKGFSLVEFAWFYKDLVLQIPLVGCRSNTNGSLSFNQFQHGTMLPSRRDITKALCPHDLLHGNFQTLDAAALLPVLLKSPWGSAFSFRVKFLPLFEGQY